jgi:hypothetical protein
MAATRFEEMLRWWHDVILAGKDIATVFWYKMRCTEFLPLFFFGIPNFGIGILIRQILQWQNKKRIRPESPESKTELEFHFRWGSQKLEPKIRILNQA